MWAYWCECCASCVCVCGGEIKDTAEHGSNVLCVHECLCIWNWKSECRDQRAVTEHCVLVHSWNDNKALLNQSCNHDDCGQNTTHRGPHDAITGWKLVLLQYEFTRSTAVVSTVALQQEGCGFDSQAWCTHPLSQSKYIQAYPNRWICIRRAAVTNQLHCQTAQSRLKRKWKCECEALSFWWCWRGRSEFMSEN